MKEKNSNLFLGILGAVIGGFIGAIPWVAMYVYGDMILSLLAIIIALGAQFGYKLFKGPVDKKLPWIIAVISIIVVVVSTLFVIPSLLMINEKIAFSFENLKILYEYEPFKNAILKDLAVSIIFTLLGISGTFAQLKKQVSENKTEA